MKRGLALILLLILILLVGSIAVYADCDKAKLGNLKKSIIDNQQSKTSTTNSFDLTLKKLGINSDQMPNWVSAIKGNPRLAEDFNKINAALAAKNYDKAILEISNLIKDPRLADDKFRVYRNELEKLKGKIQELKVAKIAPATQIHGGSLKDYQEKGYKIYPVPDSNKIILKSDTANKIEFPITGKFFIYSDQDAILKIKISTNVNEFLLMEGRGASVIILNKPGPLTGKYGKYNFATDTTSAKKTMVYTLDNKFIKELDRIVIPEYSIKLVE